MCGERGGGEGGRAEGARRHDAERSNKQATTSERASDANHSAINYKGSDRPGKGQFYKWLRRLSSIERFQEAEGQPRVIIKGSPESASTW